MILLPLSFQYVKYNEIAFVKKRTSGTISRDNVYTSGRHFLGTRFAHARLCQVFVLCCVFLPGTPCETKMSTYSCARSGPDIALVTFPASAVTVEYPGLGVWTKSEVCRLDDSSLLVLRDSLLCVVSVSMCAWMRRVWSTFTRLFVTEIVCINVCL